MGWFFSSSNITFITFVEDSTTRSYNHNKSLLNVFFVLIFPQCITRNIFINTSSMIHYAKSRIRMSLGLCGLKVSSRQESHKSKTFLTHTSGSQYSLCDTIQLLIRLDPMASVYLRWGGLIHRFVRRGNSKLIKGTLGSPLRCVHFHHTCSSSWCLLQGSPSPHGLPEYQELLSQSRCQRHSLTCPEALHSKYSSSKYTRYELIRFSPHCNCSRFPPPAYSLLQYGQHLYLFSKKHSQCNMPNHDIWHVYHGNVAST